MREQICDLECKVRLAKGNIQQISITMAGWNDAPLYQRKDGKKECLLGLEVRNAHHKINVATQLHAR